MGFMDRVEIETTELKVLKVGVNYAVSANEMAIANISTDAMMDHISKEMVYSLTARIASRHMENLEYPADWVEAFKERWFPHWLLKKYPVRYHRYDVSVLYPGIVIPNQQHYVRISTLK